MTDLQLVSAEAHHSTRGVDGKPRRGPHITVWVRWNDTDPIRPPHRPIPSSDQRVVETKTRPGQPMTVPQKPTASLPLSPEALSSRRIHAHHSKLTISTQVEFLPVGHFCRSTSPPFDSIA